MNYILISHCSFNGNSGIHAYYIASELVRLGFDCAVSVPDSPESVFQIGLPSFKVILYGTNELNGLFDDGRGADVIHSFTPRQHVRNETLRLVNFYKCPYVVHMEDNEEEILRAGLGVEDIEFLYDFPTMHLEKIIVPWRIWPVYYRSFLQKAAGITVLIAKLLEFNVGNVPSIVFWPGFEQSFAESMDMMTARMRFNLPHDKHLLLYAGAVHEVNFSEVETLLLTVAALNRRGYDVRLVKTGKDHHNLFTTLPKELNRLVINLGFVNRADLPLLLQTADVLVQPGEPGPFNDYRFPSKLPEYFASGRPVVLPKTNIGLHVEDGKNALLLKKGDYYETANVVEKLLKDQDLALKIGSAGREFAMKELTWSGNVRKLYDWLVDLLEHKKIWQPTLDVNISSTKTDDPKLIAIYLPQFHPIPENDKWWGEGFTEWTNVVPAKPNFRGHYQPRLPADLGMYDLRNPEVMEKQAKLAQDYGIFGFCFYYYWFSGKRLLEKPLETFLNSGKPSIPFCLCWANENWTRRWDGMDQDILIKQNYESGWDKRFFEDILPYLQDERYISIDGEPILILYRIDLIPYASNVIQDWKQMACSAGLGGLHVVGVQFVGMSPEIPVKMGADATMEFPPHLAPSDRTFIDPATLPGICSDFNGYVEDYAAAVRHYISQVPPNVPWYRCLMPSWDNTARRGKNSHIYINSTPEFYEQWLRYLVDYSRCTPGGRPLIFANAWNEWAEGAYLEPDLRYGRAYLEATSRAMQGYQPINQTKNFKPVCSAKLDRAEKPNTLRKKRQFGNSPDMLFCDELFIKSTLKRYTKKDFPIDKISYATVRDYCDSWDNLKPLACHGDLKNVQRPWVLKTILSQVSLGGKLLEIGGGHPLIAATLAKMGYDVTIVDPYDGTGNGPMEYENYLFEYPEVRLIRNYFRPDMIELKQEKDSFDAIYSISVLEHVSLSVLEKEVFPAIRMYLRSTGLSIHAVDYIRKGNGEQEHLEMVKTLARLSGVSENKVFQLLSRLDNDVETYYLSAEAHNAWRMGRKYDDFPMRVCVSIQFCTPARHLAKVVE